MALTLFWKKEECDFFKRETKKTKETKERKRGGNIKKILWEIL